MRKSLVSLVAMGAFSVLSACGGGGGISLADYAALNAATDIEDFSTNEVVNGAMDELSYSGFVNIGPDAEELVAYVGKLDLSINFATDGLNGDVTNFGRWTDAGPTGVAPVVPGSLEIAGSLTGSNESLGDGIVGTAVGTVDEYDFNMTMTGSILGETSRSAVVLYFNNIGDLGGGVGVATR